MRQCRMPSTVNIGRLYGAPYLQDEEQRTVVVVRRRHVRRLQLQVGQHECSEHARRLRRHDLQHDLMLTRLEQLGSANATESVGRQSNHIGPGLGFSIAAREQPLCQLLAA